MTLDSVKYNLVDSADDRTSKVEFWDNGIVFIKLKDNVTIEIEDAQNQYHFLKSK